MLPSNRKVGVGLFKDVLEKGKSFHSEHFSCRLMLIPSGKSRFSVAISKKVEKTAVGRNAMKRKVYVFIRALLPKIKEGVIGTFLIKKDIRDQATENLKKEIEFLTKKAGVLV